MALQRGRVCLNSWNVPCSPELLLCASKSCRLQRQCSMFRLAFPHKRNSSLLNTVTHLYSHSAIQHHSSQLQQSKALLRNEKAVETRNSIMLRAINIIKIPYNRRKKKKRERGHVISTIIVFLMTVRQQCPGEEAPHASQVYLMLRKFVEAHDGFLLFQHSTAQLCPAPHGTAQHRTSCSRSHKITHFLNYVQAILHFINKTPRINIEK